jgi:GNAT superfamily N-acetyltransferase
MCRLYTCEVGISLKVGGTMATEFSFSDAPLSANELCELYGSVKDQRARNEGMLLGAWENSHPRTAARVEGRLAGLARGITDKQTTLYICDLLVHPDFQGQGLAAELIRRLCEPFEDIYQTVLMTDPETIPFYEKLGFFHWPSGCMKM